MGVGIRLVNFDDLYFNHGRSQKFVLNHMPTVTEADRNEIDRLLYTRYQSTDFLSNIPSCECGKTTGQYAVGVVGFLCPHCRTHVVNVQDQVLEPLAWMCSPIGVERLDNCPESEKYKTLINPNFLAMMIKRFKLKGFDVIQWFTDTTYRSTSKVPAELASIEALGFKRGYNNFVTNFDAIIQGLLELKVYRKAPKTNVEENHAFLQLYQEQRHCIFSQYLPFPNRALLVMESANLGNYTDTTYNGLADAMQTMVSIDDPLNNYNVRKKENLTIKSLVTLMKFYDEFYRKRLAPKEGLFRKHVFGTRSHFSFRGVISSLTGWHDYDEVHVSWGIGVSVMGLHLTNKLLKRGWLPRDIKNLLFEHAQKWHPLLDELFKELIAESPWKGLPFIFQRNPSLERGSAQAMFITKVKGSPDNPREAEIPTISMSILSVSGFNADFDGDQQNGTLSIDHMTTEDLKALAPHMSTFGFDGVRKVTRNLKIPGPVVSTIANWLHWPEEPLTPEQQMRMDAIPDAS